MSDALIIKVDSSQVEKGKRSLADLAAQGARTERAIEGLGKSGISSSTQLGAMAASVKGLAGGFGALLIAQKSIASIDAFTKFNAQLKLATRSQQELLKATSDVSEISRIAQANISSIGTLYARINNSVRDLGASQKETADITENVALALKLSGATAQESSSAILQLSQAFGSGVLRGEEFNAVNEAAPALMRALAESIGQPVGKLRELASNGELTSDVLLKAFGDDGLLKKFREQANEVQTISGGWQVFTNQLTIAIGKINETTGASKILIGVLQNAATLLSVFEGGEKGSILRNFLDTGVSARQKQLSGFNISQLKGLSNFQADAKQELDKRLKAAQAPNFSSVATTSSIRPDFGTGVQAQDINKIHAAQEEKLNKIKQASTAATDALRKAEEERKRKLEEHFDVLRAGVEAEYAYNESLKAVRNSVSSLIEAAQSQLDSTQRQIDLLTIGEKGISDREIAEIKNTIAINESNEAFIRQNALLSTNFDTTIQVADAIKYQTGEYKKLIELKEKDIEANLSLNSFKLDKEQADNRIKEAERAMKEIEREQQQSSERMANSLSQALTNGLFEGFKNGESFGKNMFRNLLAFGKTFFAQQLQGILGGIFKGLFSGGGLSLGGLLGGTSGSAIAGEVLTGTGSKSIFGQLSSIKDIFSGGNNFITGAIEKLGVLFANGNGGILDKIGGFLGANAGGIGSALPYAGALLQAFTGNIKGAAFTAIGAAVGGPIGAAIGGVVGSLFGGKKKIPRFSTLRAGEYDDGVFTARSNGQKYKALGAETQIDGLSEQFARSLGGFLTGFGLDDKISTVSSLYKKRKSSYAEFSATFEGGSVSAGLKGKAKNVQDTFNRLVETVLGQTLAEAIQKSAVSDGVKKFFNGLTKKEDVSEAINALVGLRSALFDLPPVFDAIRNAIDTTDYQLSIADLKKRFANIGTYTSLFYTEQENFDTFTKQLVTQLTALNTVLPTSRDGYRSLVDGIKVTDESTSDLFHGLVALAPAMDTYFKQVEKGADAAKELADSLSPLRDESLFKTLFDYNFYKGVSDNYGSSFANQYIDGATPSYGLSNNTSVNLPTITPSNNTTISTSDPNMLNAMSTLITKVNELQGFMASIQVNTKSAAQTLTNVTGNGGDAIQTVLAT